MSGILMRWTFRICFALFIAWVIFLLSPFAALYDLAQAVEKRDISRVKERVNFPALRVSVSRQVVGDYLHTPEGRAKVGNVDGRLATNAGAAAVNPMVEELITPEALIDLLDDGWPQRIASSAGAQANVPVSLEFGSVREALKLFFASESNGFRSVIIPFPVDAPADRQFRVTMRLSGTTWRLTGIDLPRALREDLIGRVRKKSD
jgi:hypothetical protein